MSRTRDRAFALIELLVVITVIALVAALLLPALGLAKESSRNVLCMSQERQINLATITYTHEFDHFPACAGPGFLIDRSDEWGNVRQISERWPARLLPYLGTTEIYRCPVQFITLPVNTYFFNTIFCGDMTPEAYQCTARNVAHESTRLDDVLSPSNVVAYFESTRDWIGDFRWMLPGDIRWWGDYSAMFQYNPAVIDMRHAGGRHFRTPSRLSGDRWGKDNVALVDGHVRTQVSMQYLVDNKPRGVYHSFPFRPENERARYDVAALEAGEPDVGVELWTVPWW